MSERIVVSVIIPHFDQPSALRLCLQSLARQTYPASCFEVIVADNGSSDIGALAEAMSSFATARLVVEPRRGAALARNAALPLVRGDVVAFIDADCVADRGWIEAGVDALSDVDICGGEVRVTARDELRLSAVEAFEKVFAFRQRAYIAQKGFSVTANLFARRSVVDAVGPFTNGVSEDVDWCRRAVALGFRLAFNAKSIIGHPARRNWDELVRKWDRLVRERWNGFEGRSPTGRLKWAALAIATGLSAAPHLFMALTSDRLDRLSDRVAATGVLVRIRWWRARRMFAVMRAAV